MPHLPLAAISLTEVEITRFFVAIVALMGMAHFVGSLFARLKLPRVIGEIAGGLILGPTVLGAIAPGAHEWIFKGFAGEDKLLAMASEFGLVLLMFMSGMEIKARFAREDRKVAFPLLAGATLLPFIVGAAAPRVFDFKPYMGPNGNLSSLTIIIGIAVAITSIPVISKIFIDLGIMHTRFARICLTVATVEDIALWGLLAVAISLSKSADPSLYDVIKTPVITLIFFAVAMLVIPRLLNGLCRTPARNVVENRPVRLALLTCFGMVAVSELLGVKDMFGALLAGMAMCRLPHDVVEVVRTKVKAFALVFFTPDLLRHRGPEARPAEELRPPVLPRLLPLLLCDQEPGHRRGRPLDAPATGSPPPTWPPPSTPGAGPGSCWPRWLSTPGSSTSGSSSPWSSPPWSPRCSPASGSATSSAGAGRCCGSGARP